MAKGAPRTMAKTVAATATKKGPVKKMPVQAATVAADLAALKVDFNALLTKLKAAGLMASA